MYRISILKHEPRDFSYSELRQEVSRRKFFQPLYTFGQTFLAQAGLSNENGWLGWLSSARSLWRLSDQAITPCFHYHRSEPNNEAHRLIGSRMR